MDLSKAFSISTDYKDRRSPPNWELRLFAEVVFIDKTHPHAPAVLYQLKDSSFCLNNEILDKTSSFNFTRDSFAVLGEVASINKKKKEILLTNKNTVAYSYLIVASGNKSVFSFQDPEFAAGLQALIGALRVKPKIPDSFSKQVPLASALANSSQSTPLARQDADSPTETKPLGKIVHPYITPKQSKMFTLGSINKTLYEVQI